jgi:ubiquitin carboxyl-terminal hydrolase 34
MLGVCGKQLTSIIDVIDPLRKLVVDDMEDDGTDWEGSCGSSEQIDDIEMNIPGVKELHDM